MIVCILEADMTSILIEGTQDASLQNEHQTHDSSKTVFLCPSMQINVSFVKCNSYVAEQLNPSLF